MDSGYVVHGETYCSDDCLSRDYTEDEYNALYEGDDSDTAYGLSGMRVMRWYYENPQMRIRMERRDAG